MTPERRDQLIRAARSCATLDELDGFRALLSEHHELGDADLVRAIRDRAEALGRREGRR
ncbi:hypothetical protein NX862_18945 [Rhodobacter sp. KR11]|uniref:hypothetical protein n=1 Tax=Rhodobacter sp. KR11 TaxID=2974588 RepID=UPI002222614A|nr:hypothetical protein [Rhodobacter sp. KR11]MCW1920841.1 hypothetical protein [Rhodobacter sp. KR11]